MVPRFPRATTARGTFLPVPDLEGAAARTRAAITKAAMTKETTSAPRIGSAYRRVFTFKPRMCLGLITNRYSVLPMNLRIQEHKPRMQLKVSREESENWRRTEKARSPEWIEQEAAQRKRGSPPLGRRKQFRRFESSSTHPSFGR